MKPDYCIRCGIPHAGMCLRKGENVMLRWSVCKRNDAWRVYDRGVWHDTFPTLTEAHTYATQCAVADELYEPGGLTWLAKIQRWSALYLDLTYGLHSKRDWREKKRG